MHAMLIFAVVHSYLYSTPYKGHSLKLVSPVHQRDRARHVTLSLNHRSLTLFASGFDGPL
jgi:hypothetical protein